MSEGGAGGSMLLNQMPAELLENVLSCEPPSLRAPALSVPPPPLLPVKD